MSAGRGLRRPVVALDMRARPPLLGDDAIEHLMETNALLALTMMRLDENGRRQRWGVVESLMTYFSGAGALLDER